MSTFLVLVLVSGVGALWYYLFRDELGGAFQGGRGRGAGIGRPRHTPSRPVSVHEARERALERVKSQHRKLAPIAGACQNCGKKTTMPFRCKYCGGVFCGEHRLPESHDCDGI